jgi:hypothetical protein
MEHTALSAKLMTAVCSTKTLVLTCEEAPVCHNPENHTISKFVMHITFNFIHALNYSNSKRTTCVLLLSQANYRVVEIGRWYLVYSLLKSCP